MVYFILVSDFRSRFCLAGLFENNLLKVWISFTNTFVCSFETRIQLLNFPSSTQLNAVVFGFTGFHCVFVLRFSTQDPIFASSLGHKLPANIADSDNGRLSMAIFASFSASMKFPVKNKGCQKSAIT